MSNADDHTEPDWVTVCPECGIPKFRERKMKSPTYRCLGGHEFDRPGRRANKRSASPPASAQTDGGLPDRTLEAVADLYEYTGDTDTTARARDVSDSPRSLGPRLSKAAERGLVERMKKSDASRYRVTEKGVAEVTQ